MDTKDIEKILDKYKDEFIVLSKHTRSITEMDLLYSIVREVKPKKIIEFSPEYGRTSKVMIEAMKKNDVECHLYSYDLIGDSNSIDFDDGKMSRKLIVGDVKKTLTPDFVTDCDFMLVDSDHAYDFGKWYSENILTNLKSNVLVCIHDWPGYESNGAPRNYLPDPNNPLKYDYNRVNTGEPLAVKEYFIDKGLGEPIFNTVDYHVSIGEPYQEGIQSKAGVMQVILTK